LDPTDSLCVKLSTVPYKHSLYSYTYMYIYVPYSDILVWYRTAVRSTGIHVRTHVYQDTTTI